MATVTVTEEANEQLKDLPLPIQLRVQSVFLRLAEWPAVSGAKPMRGKLKGNFRIRTGGYRIIFRAAPDHENVIVWRIGDRRDIYEQE